MEILQQTFVLNEDNARVLHSPESFTPARRRANTARETSAQSHSASGDRKTEKGFEPISTTPSAVSLATDAGVAVEKASLPVASTLSKARLFKDAEETFESLASLPLLKPAPALPLSRLFDDSPELDDVEVPPIEALELPTAQNEPIDIQKELEKLFQAIEDDDIPLVRYVLGAGGEVSLRLI